MNSKRTLVTASGMTLFFAIVLAFAWLLETPRRANREVTLDEVRTRIGDKKIAKAVFKKPELESIGAPGAENSARSGGDAGREKMHRTLRDDNVNNPDSVVNYTVEPVSAGRGRLVAVNFLTIFGLWGLTLAVIVYTVRTLSRK